MTVLRCCRDSLNRVVARWPRGVRQLVSWIGVALTLPVIIAVFFYAGEWIGITECRGSMSPDGPWVCSAAGRLTSFVVLMIVFLPPGLRWGKFLQRLASGQAPAPPIPTVSLPDNGHGPLASRTDLVGLGQLVIAGPLAVADPSARLVAVGEYPLLLWPTTEGERTAIRAAGRIIGIGQRVPGFGALRVLLAYRAHADDTPRAVGVKIRLASLSLTGLIVLASLTYLEVAPVWPTIAGVVGAIDVVFLTLTARAVRVLRSATMSAP